MAIFGNNGDGNQLDSTNGFRLATKFTAGSSGTISSYHARVRFLFDADTLYIGLYADSSNAPGALLESVSQVVGAGGVAWVQINSGSFSLVNGVSYWLVVGSGDGVNTGFSVAYDDTTNTLAFKEGVGTLDDPFGAIDGSLQGQISCYATYTEGATAAVTGTAGDGAIEAQIVAGGQTVVLTLTGDTWVAAGGTFDAQRQNIINGMDSAQAEGTGWDAVVKAGLAVGAVVRTSATVVTITLSAFGSYNITATETITVTIPGSALTGGNPIVASPTFQILTNPTAAAGGTLGDGATEAQINSGGQVLTLTLTNTNWVASGTTFDNQRQNIINGLDSGASEANGWDAVVKAGLAVTDVVRTSATVVTVTLPAFGSYNITVNETITATIPSTAVNESNGDIVASPTFTITATGGGGVVGPLIGGFLTRSRLTGGRLVL